MTKIKGDMEFGCTVCGLEGCKLAVFRLVQMLGCIMDSLYLSLHWIVGMVYRIQMDINFEKKLKRGYTNLCFLLVNFCHTFLSLSLRAVLEWQQVVFFMLKLFMRSRMCLRFPDYNNLDLMGAIEKLFCDRKSICEAVVIYLRLLNL